MTAGAPCEELGHCKVGKIVRGLFDDKIVDNSQIRCREAKLGEHEVNSVHPKGKLIFEPTHIRLLEAGSIGDDKSTFSFMNILERGQSTDALTPPGMKIGGRQLRDATNRVI